MEPALSDVLSGVWVCLISAVNTVKLQCR